MAKKKDDFFVHREKLRFVEDFKDVEEKYSRVKGVNKALAVLGGLAYVGLAVYGVFNLVYALSFATYFSMAFAPTMYIFKTIKKGIIEDCSCTSISYKEFKKMVKSGEIDKLKKELITQNYMRPSKIGIPKIVKVNNSTAHKQPSPVAVVNNENQIER